MSEIYKNLDLNNLEGEVWRDVVGYNENYQVSSLGRVKSLNYNREKILSQVKRPNGYLQVILYKEGKRKNCTVHRLVANAFIPNPNNLPTVNHINENKTDNRVFNLEWMTIGDNTDYNNGRKRRAKKLSKQVYQYDKNHNLIKIWQSVNEAGRNGFDFRNISACCLGKEKSHRGFVWSYTPL